MTLRLELPRLTPYGFDTPMTYLQAMQQCRTDGNAPIITPAVMDERVAAYRMRRKHPDIFRSWTENYFDTATGRAMHEDEVKIGHRWPRLTNVTPESPLHNGALSITATTYRRLKGTTLTRQQLEDDGISVRLSKRDLQKHRGWLALADGSKERLRAYADMVFAELDVSEAMEFNIDLDEQDTDTVRPVILYRVEDGAYAYDWRHLDFANAQLVGVRLSASNENVPFSSSPSPSSASGAEGDASASHKGLEARV